MILFSSNRLERALAESTLTSWEKAKYIILIIIFYSCSGPIYVITPSFGPKPPVGNTLVNFVSTILTIIITCLGAKKCFITNKDIDDANFTERFTALSIPIAIKLFTISIIIISIGLLFTLKCDNFTCYNYITYLLNLMSPVITYIFYLLLNRSFRRLAILVNEKIPNKEDTPDYELVR